MASRARTEGRRADGGAARTPLSPARDDRQDNAGEAVLQSLASAVDAVYGDDYDDGD